jgi:hypothetical protein
LYGVDGVPDVDGDAVPDVLVSGDQETPGLSGRVYVFSGATGALLHLLESPVPTQIGYFGSAIAGTPDMDGDGMGDIIVSAVREPQIPGQPDPEGVVYLISGATGQPYQRLPYKVIHVASVPDLDGDGHPDVLLSNESLRLPEGSSEPCGSFPVRRGNSSPRSNRRTPT